jgi:hypothetical protein
VAIPHISLESEQRRRGWLLRILFVVPVVALVAGLILVDQFYLPLPVLFEQLVSRFGLEDFLRPLGLVS